jgi:hypothetical protein
LDSGNAKIAQFNEFAALAQSYGQYDKGDPSRANEVALRRLLYIPSATLQLQHGPLDVQMARLSAEERTARMTIKDARANRGAVDSGNTELQMIYGELERPSIVDEDL